MTLTDEQILEVVDDVFGHGHYEVSNPDWIRFARALLASSSTASVKLIEAAKLCRSHMYKHASNTKDQAFDKLCEALDEFESTASEPCGNCNSQEHWKQVPVEPTWEMIAKGSLLALGRNMNEATVRRVWAGMLSVAPEVEPDNSQAVALSTEQEPLPCRERFDKWRKSEGSGLERNLTDRLIMRQSWDEAMVETLREVERICGPMYANRVRAALSAAANKEPK